MWINVDKELPKLMQMCFVRDTGGVLKIASLYKKRPDLVWLIDLPHGPRVIYTPQITHWIPMPDIAAGKPKDQAVAIAMSNAGKEKKK